MIAALVAAAVVATGGQAVVLPGVAERASSPAGVAEVLVLLRGEAPADVARAQRPGDFTLLRLLPRVGALSARVTPAGLARLQEHPAVSVVQLDEVGHAMTAQSAEVAGVSATRDETGLTGRGVTVAILDTGVDAVHRDLDGGVVAQACFALGGCGPDAGSTSDLAPEGSGHGTHVAGIITGDGVVAPKGLAPDAKIVVVRVFDDSSVGRVSDWAAGLDWLLQQQARRPVRVVNLSFGTDSHYSGACDEQQPVLSAAVAALRDAGVVVFAASGNEFKKDAMVAPACLKAVVAVGATYDSDLGREPDTGGYSSGCADLATDAGRVVCFSNASDELDLLAPGSRIRAAAPGNRVAERRGTSQATPHAAAIAALLLELDPQLSPDEVERLLKQTGQPVADPADGRVTPLLNAQRAVHAAFAGYCARRANFEPCALALACDGGLCPRAAQCFDGQCVVAFPAAGGLPAAPGCSAAGLGAGTLALLAVVLALRRR